MDFLLDVHFDWSTLSSECLARQNGEIARIREALLKQGGQPGLIASDDIWIRSEPIHVDFEDDQPTYQAWIVVLTLMMGVAFVFKHAPLLLWAIAAAGLLTLFIANRVMAARAIRSAPALSADTNLRPYVEQALVLLQQLDSASSLDQNLTQINRIISHLQTACATVPGSDLGQLALTALKTVKNSHIEYKIMTDFWRIFRKLGAAPLPSVLREHLDRAGNFLSDATKSYGQHELFRQIEAEMARICHQVDYNILVEKAQSATELGKIRTSLEYYRQAAEAIPNITEVDQNTRQSLRHALRQRVTEIEQTL
jgi:hypothetical protein